MARRLVDENLRKIEQIVQSSYSYKQKREEMKSISTDYIHKYCLENRKFVKFPRSNVIKKFITVSHRMIRDEIIDLALDSLIFYKDEEYPTFLDLYDLCFWKDIIKEDESLNQYRKGDLHELLNRKGRKKTQYITGELLFLSDISYLYRSPPNDFNLRNLCIYEGFIDKKEFGKVPKKSEYYENILEYNPIRKNMQVYIHIYSICRGYEYNEEESYFDFLNIPKFPSTIKEYIDLQESSLVDIYNRVADKAHKFVVDNILDIVRDIKKYDFYLRKEIRVIFLQTKSLEYLMEIKYDGKFDDPKKLEIKVDEILYS